MVFGSLNSIIKTRDEVFIDGDRFIETVIAYIALHCVCDMNYNETQGGLADNPTLCRASIWKIHGVLDLAQWEEEIK